MTRQAARAAALLGLVVIAAAVSAVPAPASTSALFVDAAGSSAAMDAELLDPPTALVATGGASILLAWVPSVDGGAAGYRVYRAAAAAGPYAAVGTAMPIAATSYLDGPAAGTWFYTVRTFVAGWESADAGPVSAAATSILATGLQSCTANAADTTGAGDNNGYQTNAANACTDTLPFASDAASGTGGTEACGTGATPDVRKDRHRYWGFPFGLPPVLTAVQGIEIEVDVGLNNNGGNSNLCAQLSWDGGTTWTNLKAVAITAVGRNTYLLGGPTDTWGRAWTAAELSAATFRVRLVNASSMSNKTFELYRLQVEVTYTP